MSAPIWPPDVYVLSVSDELYGEGCNGKYWPRNYLLWVSLELRRVAHKQTIHHIKMMNDVWYREHKQIRLCFKRKQSMPNPHQHYNLAWASLGYVHGQTPAVLQFLKVYDAYTSSQISIRRGSGNPPRR